MPQPLSAVLIGAGNRGYEAYGPYALAHPEQIQFRAVAEPQDARRQRFARAHHIPASGQFITWQDALSGPRIADVAIICTLDQMHLAPAVAALESGYDVLLEKPMATTVADCLRLVHAAQTTGKLLQIAHVLRFSPFFTQLHRIVTSGRLGRVVTVEHRENVSYWHMAHSYVRGNWRDSRQACPMILAKCCHDLDILYWNCGPCARLSSFGSLLHYRLPNAPQGAPERCTDACPAAEDCPWYAPRLYIQLAPLLHEGRRSTQLGQRLASSFLLRHPAIATAAGRLVPGLRAALDYQGWPVSTIAVDSSLPARWHALQEGPYGRCVYHCDNNVVDHQTVSMELENGATAVLVMHGHSYREGRTMRYEGTRATLLGRYHPTEQVIEIHDHFSDQVETIRPLRGDAKATGHGGGDEGLMAAFVDAVRHSRSGATSALQALESHLMALAAERARLSGTVVDMDRYRQQARETLGQKPQV